MDTEMEAEAYSQLTPVQSFFFGRSVFITGASGFLGKVLVEKLLRCCPGIGMLYLLMRPKRGATPTERVNKILSAEIFCKAAEVFPNYRKHVQIIDGDLEKEQLGISCEDLEILRQNVSIVFHVGARVQFNDPIKVAVQHNVIGTRAFVALCHELPHLAVMVHVSTSYVKREEDGSVLEQVPKTKVTPKQIINAMEWLDPKSQQCVEDFLLEGKSTTYTLSKALAEQVIEENRDHLPTAIIRPCYISPTYKDPFPGWCDTLQGISGLMLAGGKGVLRALLSVKDLKLNVIPIDLVVNCIIVSAWYVGTKKPKSIYVSNCVIDYEKLPYADQDILNISLKKRSEYPLSQIFRYPDFKIYYNPILYYIHSIFDEWIPAYICDFFLFIFTGKTILVKVYKKIRRLYGVFHKMARTPWICRLDNYHAMRKSLSATDTEIFFLSYDDLDWEKYVGDCMYAGRKYLAKEDPSNIPYAKKKAKVWLCVTTFFKWCIISYILHYVFSHYAKKYFLQ